MSDSNMGQIANLIAEAEDLPYGEVRTKLADEAVRLADATRDLDVMFEARLNFVIAAGFSGDVERAIAAFAWCLAQFESDPDRFDPYEHTVLWYFKNILHSADELPDIRLEQVEGLRAQMASHFRQYGYASRPVHHTRLAFATRAGDRVTATEAFEQIHASPRDSMADCQACEADDQSEYYELIDELEKAVEIVEPNLSGLQSCAEVPHRTYNLVLRPLALLGRYEEADEYREKGYRLIRNNPAFLRHVAMQMLYLVHRKRIPPALRMLERHLAWALETYELRSRFMFYLAASRLLTHLAGRRSSHKLDLPQAFPAYEPSAKYDLATLIDWFDTRRIELGKRFDERNGNTFFSDELVTRLQY